MDITLVGIPEGITEQEVKEWVSILVQRKEEQKLTPPKEVVDASLAKIDSFRTANSLQAKYVKELESQPLKELEKGVI